MNMTRSLACTTAAAALAAFTASAVDAASVGVRITYGTTVVEFYDNDLLPPVAGNLGNDLNPDTGTIDFNLGGSEDGGLFSALGFTALEVDGARCTVCPSTLTLDVEASNRGSTTPLEVLVSGIDYMLPQNLFYIGQFLYSGILPGGTITTEAYWDPGNAFFGMTELIGSEFVDGGPYAGMQSEGFPNGTSPYSMTLRMEFGFESQTSTLQSQSQVKLSAIPVPAALPLLLGGLGLLGALGARRRRA